MTTYRDMPRLERALCMRGIWHPTWFCWIVERIARRRFVSWAEIEGPLLDWYSAKHGYGAGAIYQHGIGRQLRRYWRIGGVIGGRDWTGMFHSRGERNLICRLDENGKRMDSQHCEICGTGINPVWGGQPKRRLTCRNPVCHDIYRWWYSKSWAGEAARFWASVSPELQKVAMLWWYLDRILKQGGRHGRKAVRAHDRRAA